MWKADQWKDYEVLDTSDGEKLERWGSFYLVRPDPQVIWSTPRQDPRWKRFDARYARSSTGGGHWSAHHLPEHWCIRYRELTFQVKPMNFKHTGVFPEQAANWDFIDEQIRRAGRPVSVLNLFAYTGGGKWSNLRLPEHWQVKYRELTFNVKPMNFKHTGVFPEQAANWDFIMETIRGAERPINALNLFAYTGGATLACAAAGASVCHVDAAKGMVAWAKENAKSSGLEDRPIRWIVDDCAKFVEREIRRGRRYDAIIMDPPS